MMDITKSPYEFQAWWNAPEQAELRNSCAMGWGFRIWKAARESLVVELPEIYSNGVPKCDEYDRAISECSAALRTAGIRIKGECE
ncbi:hypothetical protein QK140_003047 [Yersinia enterocolitica]|nr:hypothetical protein [Yersinia enterocolitica]